jgi:hypothetical protein
MFIEQVTHCHELRLHGRIDFISLIYALSWPSELCDEFLCAAEMTFIKYRTGRKPFTAGEDLLLWHQVQLHGKESPNGWAALSERWSTLANSDLVKGPRFQYKGQNEPKKGHARPPARPDRLAKGSRRCCGTSW